MNSVQVIPILQDNYSYLLPYKGLAIAIDPGQAAPLLEFTSNHNLMISHILLTHHHKDHTEGALEIAESHGSFILGPIDALQDGPVDQALKGGEILEIGSYVIEVWATSGHTKSHLCFFLPDKNSLFSGDALFGAGIGRFDHEDSGLLEDMYLSLQKLTHLPKETKVYPGHEYTLENLAFAHSLEPNNPAIEARKKAHEKRLKKVPFSIEEEKRTNPFFRLNVPEIQHSLRSFQEKEMQVLQKMRAKKDGFSQ